MENKTVQFIIARHHEDISWTNPLSPNRVIYNKGDITTLSNVDANEKVITLPNVGRESHTYLTYIIDNYDNLPDICVFTQGNISDHRGRNDPNILVMLAYEAADGKEPVGMSRLAKDSSHPAEPTWGRTWNRNYNFVNYKDNTFVDFWQWFEKNIEMQWPVPITYYPHAIFAVSKERIRSRPKEFYKKLIKLVDWHVDPIDGHFFERSWYHIFCQ